MALEIRDVTKSFPAADGQGVTHALTDVSLTLEANEFAVMVGPSGCGKSTLLRIVAGLTRPTTGTVILDGEVVRGPDSSRGMAFQKSTLFPWLTVRQNIAFGPRMRGECEGLDEHVERIIHVAGLEEFSDFYPYQLSGGMAQRAALVRTMINDPKVLLLDEPLGALDAFTRMAMQDEVLSMWRRAGSVGLMVTHDVDEAVYMGTCILVMAPRPGRVVERIDVDLPFPRDRTSGGVVALRTRILNTLGIGREGNS